MKLSQILEKHGATEYFLENFDKSIMDEWGEWQANINHTNKEFTNEEWEKQEHPFIKAMNEYEDYDNIIHDMNSSLGLPTPELLLIKFESNWADEMDIEGYYVTTVELYNKYIEEFKKYFEEEDSLSYCVGTNEEIEFDSLDELLECYDTKSITISDYEVLEKLNIIITGFTGPEVYLDS